MPALMTHDFFGRDVLHALSGGGALSVPERDAFLLGNQGPDPLFYLRIDPARHTRAQLGNRMHAERTDELLIAFKQSLSSLAPADVPIGRAYAQGFLCHYLLDSSMHPLVYAEQFAICDAGVPGLTRADGFAVHAVIEGTYDEMVLYAKYVVTVADYSPAVEILRADKEVLRIISQLYDLVCRQVYGVPADGGLFAQAVHCFRFGQHAFYSPGGGKRVVLAALERTLLHHRHAAVVGMSHRALPTPAPWYANPDHAVWRNPWTGVESTRSFWDIYEAAVTRAVQAIARFEKLDFTAEDAAAITGGVNFSGMPLDAASGEPA